MEMTYEKARDLLPKRPAQGHKGTFGHVFILAGSRGFTGAAKLAALAAGRSGAGLVTVGTPRPLADIMAVSLLEAMSLPLPATKAESLASAAVEPALAFAEGKQAVVLGPGISQQPGTTRFVLEFARWCPVPLLLDADGLNAVASAPDVLNKATAPIVVTPHPGEMARLSGASTKAIQEDRVAHATAFAGRYGCVVVLKGSGTVIADPAGEHYVNPTGNSGLASGGTGDVLSGLVGGLMAQGMTPVEAAALGVYLHGRAGDMAAARLTQRALLARDVIDAMPEAWHELEMGGGR